MTSNGANTLPVGASGSRPSAVQGRLRMNSSYSPAVLEFFDGSNWRPVTGYSSGTVGTGGQAITYKNGGISHAFTSVGSHTFTPAFSGTVQVLVVAGGGGGAGSHGGGGGGGGVLYNDTYPVTAGAAINVTVGGGATNGGYGSFPSNGGNSTFGSTTSTGGGGGGIWNQGTTDSRSGGSGGGAGSSGDDGSRFRVSGGNGTQGQGFPGGAGVRFNTSGDNAHLSGGGGGAGGPGHYSSDNRNDEHEIEYETFLIYFFLSFCHWQLFLSLKIFVFYQRYCIYRK